MNDNPTPLGIHPDNPLEARITAWVLGEASPFEIAELESLAAKSPELQLFLNRTRALHALLQEAETTANSPSEDWRLPNKKRAKLSPILGDIHVFAPEKESRIRRASFRAAWGIAAVFVVTFFSLRLLPGDYEAEAVIEVKPRERRINPLSGEMSKTPTMTPQFFGTEFEKIKSRNSLEKVIDNLDLTTRWNTDKETALKRLKDSVETENIRGTDLIAIRVRQPDEQEAKEITRAVTEGYRDYRNTLEEKQHEFGLDEIRKAVRQQEDKVEERRKVLTTISRTKNTSYHGEPGVTGQNDPDESGIIAQRESKRDALERSIDTSDYVDAKQDFETDLALLEQMKIKLITEEISGDLPSESVVIHEDPVITGKKFPSNPIAALSKVLAADTRSSAPLQTAEARELRVPVPAAKMAETSRGERDSLAALADGKEDNERSGQKQIEIAGNTEAKDEVIRREVPAQPNSSSANAIAANTAPTARIPVPDPASVAPSADFGDGDDFGAGWAGGSGGGGAPPTDDEAPGYDRSTKTGAGTLNLEGGNRSGDTAINRNSIDAILNNSDRAASAGKPAEPAAAPASEMSGLAQREIIRRQESVAEADRNLLGGRDAYEKGDYGQAVDKYKDALKQLPDSPATADRRESYTEHLNDASIAQAQQLRKVGKYDEARELLKQAETSAPGEKRIKDEIAYLEDPIRTNPALTYEHTKDVEEVRRNLYKAQGNYELGKYDEAKKAYEDTLRIDPYNKAARRGMEKISAAKSDYYRAAYDHNRSELLTEADEKDVRADLLAEVDKAWDSAVAADPAVKEGKANEQVDLFADSSAPGEIGSLTGLFSNGSTSAWNDRLDTYSGYRYSADETSNNADRSLFSDFEGFANYGAPIAGAHKQIDITTKHVEISQANDKELGFDWIVSPFTQKGNISSGSVIPVTPATPTDFESRLTGNEGEVVPLLGDIPLVGRLFHEADPFWDTSEAMAKNEGKGGVEYEIHAGYNSEYLFRGTDLAEIQQPIDLADLSQEIPATHEPFSTFSLNISDASFQLALAAVEKGERPDPETIKPEQFYNAVSYGDPAPSTGEPVAAAIAQLAHPVIPGRNLVRMSVRTASTGRAATQPLVLTLLVDQSGSMARGDRRAAMDTALAQLAKLLTPDDSITVIGFSRTPRLLADSISGDQAQNLADVINQSASEGGTNLEEALDLAENLALRHRLDGAQNRIVLFTDGAANLGNADPELLAGRVKSLRQQDLAFDIAGIGTDDINDRLLSELARHGDGRYYLVGEKTAANLAKQLAGAFRPAAENVKIQVRFNPQRVGHYKLLGFEKDRLKTEDFRNDSVDAAELAADESGTALYQVEPLPNGSGELGELFVRFRDTSTGEMVERSWTIPYESQAPVIDKAQPPMQLAALSLLAAQKLKPGPLADAINFRDLAPTISAVKQAYARSPEAQQMVTLINALK